MAVAFRLLQPVDEELLLALSRANPDKRFETTSSGELVVSALTGTLYSFGEAQLSAQVVAWNDQHRLGYVLPASGGVTLPDGAVKGPDAAFISREQWSSLSETDRARAFIRVAPTVVFELLSPNDDPAQTLEKIDEYLRTGSSVAVLLDPRDRTVRVYRVAGDDPEMHREPAHLAIGAEMPGFVLNARAVFDACEGRQ